MTINDLPSPCKGTKVYYKDPYTGEIENGIIQTFIPSGTGFSKDITEVFVVYKSTCGGQWDKYQNFTAQRTKLSSLHLGWAKKMNLNLNHLIKNSIHNAHR